MRVVAGGRGRGEEGDEDDGWIHGSKDYATLRTVKNLAVIREPWKLDPLAWIHRAEALAIARELGAPLVSWSDRLPEGPILLRLSDPFMRRAVAMIDRDYLGPGTQALERCYDKYEAHRRVAAGGLHSPATWLGDSPTLPDPPFVLKPRRGSDSIGVRIVSAVPAAARNAEHLVQSRIVGREVTVALFRDRVGMPLEILVPRGTPYAFAQKYLMRPPRRVLDEESLRDCARHAGQLLGIDWAARVDFIVDDDGRAFFLECDAAPLVGAESVFAASFAAAGVERRQQLDWLVA